MLVWNFATDYVEELVQETIKCCQDSHSSLPIENTPVLPPPLSASYERPVTVAVYLCCKTTLMQICLMIITFVVSVYALHSDINFNNVVEH